MSKLKGKVAIVTGASRGEASAFVLVNYASSRRGAEKVVAEIVDAGGTALAVSADVSKVADAQALVDAAVNEFGRLDILVNNCGISDLKPLEAVKESDFDRVFHINVLGPILVTQAAIKHLGEHGSIINIGSGASRITPASSTVYTSSKAAVDALTGVWAQEFGSRKIRVNSINPGLVETEGSISNGYIGSDFEKWMISQAPLGRTGRVTDISSIAVFLGSDDSAWLTGELLLATGGIGLATAKLFVSEGAHVFITGRRQNELDRAAQVIGGNVTGVRGDVSNLQDLDRLYEAVQAKGRIDILFANAGVGDFASLEKVTEEHFDKIFNVNVKGALFTVQKALPLLNNGGSIILTGSVSSAKGTPAFGVYAASKAALRNLVRAWTVELKDRGVRSNVISPGPTDTPFLASVPPERAAQIISTIPMGRMGRAEEVAKAALFLASDDSSYVTGIELFVDGGRAQI